MKLVVLGLGFSAGAFVRQGAERWTSVAATVRTPEKAAALREAGIAARIFADGRADPELAGDIAEAEALLVSLPAEDGGDPALAALGEALRAARRLRWIGYLSTVGVYGNHDGASVDETAELRASSPRTRNRIVAERGWLELGAALGAPVQIFRLAGIYGPGRNALVNLRRGTARRIVKAGQVFSRIHVEDIAGACLAGLDRPDAGRVFNVADDEPAPPQDVIAYAAGLLGLPVPPDEPFETAEMTPMARSFYLDNRRIDNGRLRRDLGYRLRYPSYREGLDALAAAGEGR